MNKSQFSSLTRTFASCAILTTVIFHPLRIIIGWVQESVGDTKSKPDHKDLISRIASTLSHYPRQGRGCFGTIADFHHYNQRVGFHITVGPCSVHYKLCLASRNIGCSSHRWHWNPCYDLPSSQTCCFEILSCAMHWVRVPKCGIVLLCSSSILYILTSLQC